MTGSLGDNEQILVAIDSGVYNARKATCGTYCQTWNGRSALLYVPGIRPNRSGHNGRLFNLGFDRDHISERLGCRRVGDDG